MGEKILVRVDPEIAHLVPRFLQNRHQDAQAIREALAKGDFEAVRILGHSMKGIGEGYGFVPVTQLGSSLEQAAREGDVEKVRKSVEELQTYLDSVEVVHAEP